MASNAMFQRVSSRGWLQGFDNRFANENARWWKTRRWLVQVLVWLLIVNGFLAVGLLTASRSAEADAAVRERLIAEGEDPNLIPPPLTAEETGALLFFVALGIGATAGVAILGQDAVVGEKHSGTAAWLLSKPASRPAFILSRLAAYSLGILVTVVVVQGAVGYGLFFAVTGNAINLLPYLAAMGLAFLVLLFYLTLSIMLGTLFNSRGAVIGIPLVIIAAYQIIPGLLPWIEQILPWKLLIHLAQPSLAENLLFGRPVGDLTPVFFTVLWCVVFTAVAVWRFNREEF